MRKTSLLLVFLIVLAFVNLSVNPAFATEIFSDDFESGFSPWDGQVTAVGGSISVIQFLLSNRWTTISGNPTDRHGFDPVHKTRIVEVNKIVDGEARKYLAYDSDEAGSEIRLYYTDDLDGSWTSYSGNPILGPSANHFRTPTTAYDGTTFHMFVWDRTDTQLERWTSTDGINYTFQEVILNVTDEFIKGYIWFNPNDNKWYLYHTKFVDASKYTYARNAANIEDLDTAEEYEVVNGITVWSVIYRNGKYYFVSEVLVDSTWTVTAYESSSPDSELVETEDSPILTDDEACPILVINPDGVKIYLFSNRDKNNWYQDTREVSFCASHHGKYVARAIIFGVESLAYEYKTVTSAKEYYMRQYLRVTALPSSNGDSAKFSPYLKDQTNNKILGRLALRKDASGNLQVGLEYENSGTQLTWINQDFSVDTWYCVEVRVKCGAGTGEAEVWWDENKIIDLASLTNNYNIERIWVGAYQSGGYITHSWFDCVVVADAYVGPEGQDLTFTLTETIVTQCLEMTGVAKEPPHGGWPKKPITVPQIFREKVFSLVAFIQQQIGLATLYWQTVPLLFQLIVYAVIIIAVAYFIYKVFFEDVIEIVVEG